MKECREITTPTLVQPFASIGYAHEVSLLRDAVQLDQCRPLVTPIFCLSAFWKRVTGATSGDIAIASIISPSAELVSSPASISQDWLIVGRRDGPDGPWSTFTLRVGTPAQNVRVLISTASQSTWVVVPEGCNIGDTACQDERGATFNYNSSSTWASLGNHSLFNEENLGFEGSGLWGNDTLGLGFQGSGGPTLNKQSIAGITTDDFYVGMFGVNPKPTNYTGIERDQQDSCMTSLKKHNLIPSITFGYTAGAPYRLKKVLGSLTLGGYDQSRFIPNPHSFKFAPDKDRDLVVGVQSITFSTDNGTTKSLLPSGILSYVDSTIPYISLPPEACKAFEEAFNLEYNATTEMYPVSNSLHADLMAQNARITFTLGDDVTGGQTVNVTLPYDSFDLTATFPVVEASTRYFPLKRAINDTQHTLGRTFLQEAYLIVDYERSNFSISQCLFQDGIEQKLIGIPPVETSNSTTPDRTEPSKNHSTAIIGGAVGGSILVVAVVASVAGFFLVKKRRAAQREKEAKATAARADEEAVERLRQGFDKKHELGVADHALYEIGGSETGGLVPPLIKEKAGHFDDCAGKYELMAGDVDFAELPGRKGSAYEMYDSSIAPVELPADMPKELPTKMPSRRSSALTPSSGSARQTPPRLSATSPFSDPAGHPDPRNSVSPRSPGQPSPIDHRLGRTPPTRSSTSDSHPFLPSSPSQSGPSSLIDQSMQSSPRSERALSPLSPINGSDGGVSPTERRPSHSSSQSPPIPTPPPGSSSRGKRSPHISAMRSDDSRKRERRRRNQI